MTDRATPRTDAKTFDPYPWNNNGPGRSHQPQVMYPCDDGSWVDADHARELERELAEAREETLEQARLLGMSGQREAKLLSELAEAKESAQRAMETLWKCGLLPSAYDTIEKAATGAREQVQHFRKDHSDPPAHLVGSAMRKMGVRGFMEEGETAELELVEIGELAKAKEQRDRMIAFVESMVDALGPFPDINGTSVIPAAYAILREAKGGA